MQQAALALFGDISGEDFHGDVPIQEGIVGVVDYAHSAAPNFGSKCVAIMIQNHTALLNYSQVNKKVYALYQ
jgi:hypothetical protein